MISHVYILKKYTRDKYNTHNAGMASMPAR